MNYKDLFPNLDLSPGEKLNLDIYWVTVNGTDISESVESIRMNIHPMRTVDTSFMDSKISTSTVTESDITIEVDFLEPISDPPFAESERLTLTFGTEHEVYETEAVLNYMTGDRLEANFLTLKPLFYTRRTW